MVLISEVVEAIMKTSWEPGKKVYFKALQVEQFLQ